MRARAAAVLLLSAGLLVACGDDADTASDGTTPVAHGSSAAAGAQLTKAQVREAVLTASDMPAGWSFVPSSEAGSDDDDDMVFAPAECNTRFYALTEDEDDPVFESSATFVKQGGAGATLEATVMTHADAWDGERLADLRSFLADCGTMTTRIEGQTFDVRMGELAVPELGDGRLGIRLSLTGGGMTFVGDLALVAVGHNGVMLSVFGETPLEGTELEQITRAAVERLERTASGTAASPTTGA